MDFERFYAGRANDQIAPADGEILISAIDCKGIPIIKSDGATGVVRRGKGEKANKKKIVTVVAVHSQPPTVRTPAEVIDSLFNAMPARERPRPTRERVWASLTTGKDAPISDVKEEMTHRDPEHKHTWVIVADGERSLQRRVIASFENVTLILDLLDLIDISAFSPEPESS